METYKKLARLCKQNPAVFGMAFSICLDVGAENVRKGFTIGDMPVCKLFEPDFIEQVVEATTMIANASPGVVTALLQREATPIEGDGEDIPPRHYHGDEDGICPVCGAEINYLGDNQVDDEGTSVSWECPECGTSGKSGYTSVFDRHYDVTDSLGKSIPGRKD